MPASSGSRSLPSALVSASRLTRRDQVLLRWLAEHYVLTTEQIDNALFGSRRYTQRRLATLTRLGFLARFAAHAGTAEVTSMRYALGPLGMKIHPDAAEFGSDRTRRGDLTERLLRLSQHPRLDHLLGVNSFFTALHAHSREHPGQARLSRWWSEQHATATLAAYPGRAARPDGHGVWSQDGGHVGFFLEHDTGTEPLRRVLDKLPAYANLAQRGGLRYPVLVHVPSARREANLLAALAELAPRNVVVATAVHGSGPAEAVWALPGGTRRLRLGELPCDHGPTTALNPARFDAPDEDPF